MSTTTLLIVTARLRSIARPDGRQHPASSVPPSGRSRVTGHGASWLAQFRQQGTGNRSQRALPVLRLSTPLETLAGAGWFPLPRVRLLALASLFILLSPAMPTHSALAQQAGQPATPPTLELPVLRVEADAPQSASRTIGGNAPTGPCVIVDIAGDRAGHLDCATQRLQDAARTAQSEARAAIDAPVIGAGSPDVQTGVAHEGATRLRMGNALGRSVYPERPASRPPRVPRP